MFIKTRILFKILFKRSYGIIYIIHVVSNCASITNQYDIPAHSYLYVLMHTVILHQHSIHLVYYVNNFVHIIIFLY